MSTKIATIWSDLDHRLVQDAQGVLKKVTNVKAVMTSVDNILRTSKGERCFVGNTEIALLNGTNVKIEELANTGDSFWVYTFNQTTGRIEPGMAKAFKTGRKKVIKITLDNNEVVQCTPEHKIMLRNGHYKEASKLIPGNSLMSLYLSYTPDGYIELYQPLSGVIERVHHMVSNWKTGRFDKNNCIHHKNFSKQDNEPGNLLRTNNKLHFKYHARKAKIHNHKLWHTPEYQWYRDMMSSGEVQRKAALSPGFGESISAGIQKHLSIKENREEWSKRTSEVAKRTNSNPENKEKQREVGRRNGIRFHHDPTMKEVRDRNQIVWKEGYLRVLQTKEYQETLKKNGREVGKSSILFKLRKHYGKVIQIYGSFCETTWEIYRKTLPHPVAYPIWKSIVSSGVLEKLTLNHKVISVVDKGKVEDVYDIRVEKTHNFALASGIFVHNCMLPEFGSSLKDMVFESMNSPIIDLISRDLKNEIEMWDDRVIVSQVRYLEEPDNNAVIIEISFAIKGYYKIFKQEISIKGEAG